MSEEEESQLGWEEDRQTLRQFLAMGGTPAFMARAARVEQEWQRIVQLCRKQRKEWLQVARVRLGRLIALAGDWKHIRPLLSEERDLSILIELHNELQPQLRVPIQPNRSVRILRRAIIQLCESLEFFNARWQKFLLKVDLQPLNVLREKYNKYYIMEKECLIGSSVLAKKGFQKLEPLTVHDLLEILPLEQVPRLIGN